VEKDNEISKSIELFKKGLDTQAYKNTAENFIKFGVLLLKDKKTDQAFEYFEKGLQDSSDYKKSLEQIYHFFHKEKAYESFLNFAAFIGKKFNPPDIVNLFIARARMKMELYDLAKAGLLQMVSNKPNTEAFYLLSVIAEKEGDWDSMELNIQRASALDPKKCLYYSKFAKALNKQGKNIQAKIQQARAKQCFASKIN